MKFIINLVFFILLISMASASDFYILIEEGLGAGDGDSNKYEDFSTLPADLQNYVYKSKDSASFQDKVKIEMGSSVVIPNALLIVKAESQITDTAKDPIDWTPIIIWGSIIGFISLLLIGGWYIYQIYFY